MIKAGLDIGNSKLSCIVADYKNPFDIKILSLSSIPTNNIKKKCYTQLWTFIWSIKINTFREWKAISNEVKFCKFKFFSFKFIILLLWLWNKNWKWKGIRTTS